MRMFRLTSPRNLAFYVIRIVLLALSLGAPSVLLAQTPLGTAFTYQGRLTDAGSPSTGSYDFEFRLFDAPIGGAQFGGTVTKAGLPVSSGLFTTSLDFGASAFAGSRRWLEIAVKAPAAGSYTVLAPRQELTPSPNALWAAKAGEASSVVTGALVAPAIGGSVGVNTANPAGAGLVVAPPPTQVYIIDGFEDGTLTPFATSGQPWTVTTGATVPWESPPQRTVLPFAGARMARSATGNDVDSRMTYSFTVTAPARVSFMVYLESEGGYDFLNVYLDGLLRWSGTGTVNWTRFDYDVGPGSHTLMWQYLTDSIVEIGIDSALVDDVRIEAVEPAIVAMGRVGIGTAAPLDMLDVAGDIRVGTGATGCVKDADGSVIAGTCSSDARLKTNVAAFAPMLDRVAQLQPVEFDWRAKEFPEKGFGERRSFGLIAQEVEKLFPELVVTDAEGYKAVNYSRLPLVLLQALKEVHAQLEAERARSDGLEEERLQNDRLEQRLAEIERRLPSRHPSTPPVTGRPR